MALTKITNDGVDFSGTTDFNVDSGTLVVDASTNRVGVGTSAPATLLEIASNANSQTASTIPTLRITNTDTTAVANNIAGSVEFFSKDASEPDVITGYVRNIAEDAGTKYALSLGTKNAGLGAAERLRIDSSGRVGIGTSSITGFSDYTTVQLGSSSSGSALRLVASGDTPGTDDFVIYKNTSGSYLRSYGDPIIFYGSNAEYARFDTSGRLGIGTTTPQHGLSLLQGKALGWVSGAGNAKQKIEATGTDGLDFYTGSTPTLKATLDASGRLLVGTSSSDTSRLGTSTYNPQLQVKGAWTNGTASITCTNDYPVLWLNGTAGAVANAGVGRISFNSYDGTNYTQAASIDAQVDGTPGSNDMPGRLVFSTTADGAASPTERMRITSAGYVQCKNQPYFMGVLSSNQSVSNVTETKIAFTDASDRTGAWDNTNDEFDIQVDGMYLVCLDVQYTDDVNQLHNGIKVNGGSPATGFDPYVNSGNNERGASRSAVFNLTSGDTISLWTYHNSGATRTLEYNRTKVTIAFLG